LVALVLASLATPAAAQPSSAPDFDAIMAPQGELREPITVTPARPWDEPQVASGGAIEVSLPTFQALWEQTRATARALSSGRLGPALVLGAARYSGRAVDGALHLDVDLSLTLGRPGAWKTVPLVGEGAVLVSAEVDGAAIGVTTRSGYHVWLTRKTGEVVVHMKLLVAPRGPRGSIEYDLVTPRTPVTSFSCRFPVAGLEPRVDDTVRSEVTSDADSTTLTATLRPTTRIHLVGFRDLGDSAGTQARVYAESLNLLSVDDGALELFSEIKYTILYAGTKRFDVLVPPGLTVVSADGRGAFRYELEERDDGTLVRGETAYPIRDDYAVSLRLRRETKKGGERFRVPLPKNLGVERDAGWVAVEVPGKMRLEEASRGEGLSAIDTRQLPPELVRSSVSPILRAYHYTTSEAPLELAVTRLPERDIASESVDRVEASTVVSREGVALTELHLTLRNRLRPGLALTLPASAEVRSVLLDGAPTKPSRDQAGRLLLPLKRSAGAASSLTPIDVQLVYEEHQSGFGWIGSHALGLPALELPVAVVEWRVYLPSDHRYGAFDGDVGEGYTDGRWSQAVVADSGSDESGGGDLDGAFDEGAPSVETAETGAMPVRITLPTAGRQVTYSRFWVPAEEAVMTRFRYVAGWVPAAGELLAGLLLVLGAWLVAGRRKDLPGVLVRAGGAALVVAGGAGVVLISSAHKLIPFLVLALIAVMLHRKTIPVAWRSLREWSTRVPERYRGREARLERTVPWRGVGRVVLLVALVLVGLALLDDALQIAVGVLEG
jgi:membrane protein implicated in regulation of membrane protease activity